MPSSLRRDLAVSPTYQTFKHKIGGVRNYIGRQIAARALQNDAKSHWKKGTEPDLHKYHKVYGAAAPQVVEAIKQKSQLVAAQQNRKAALLRAQLGRSECCSEWSSKCLACIYSKPNRPVSEQQLCALHRNKIPGCHQPSALPTVLTPPASPVFSPTSTSPFIATLPSTNPFLSPPPSTNPFDTTKPFVSTNPFDPIHDSTAGSPNASSGSFSIGSGQMTKA